MDLLHGWVRYGALTIRVCHLCCLNSGFRANFTGIFLKILTN